MNLYFRLLLVLLRARFGAALGPLDTAVTPFRAWPHDLDVNAHVNNGRFATLMDLGRVDLMARAGLLSRVRRARWHPVVTAQHITYRRGLPPFGRFELRTRVVGWDERFVFLEQTFVRGGRPHAWGAVQSMFVGPEGRVPTRAVTEAFGLPPERAVPDAVAALFPPVREPAREEAARATA